MYSCLSHNEDPYILCICKYICICIALPHDSLIDRHSIQEATNLRYDASEPVSAKRQDCAQVRVAPKGRQHPDVRLKLAMFATNAFWLKALRFGSPDFLS